jgi:hypothetical protein
MAPCQPYGRLFYIGLPPFNYFVYKGPIQADNTVLKEAVVNPDILGQERIVDVLLVSRMLGVPWFKDKACLYAWVFRRCLPVISVLFR